MSRNKTTFSTKQEAVEYLDKVLREWEQWAEHHKLLVEAIKVVLHQENEETRR